MKSHKCCS